MVRWQKQVFIHTWLSRAYLALARLSCEKYQAYADGIYASSSRQLSMTMIWWVV